MEHKPYPKTRRVEQIQCRITEKIDGTNALLYVDRNKLHLFAGSRNRWLDEENDNHGFYKWAMENKEALMQLPDGYHYGEWAGPGIGRKYKIPEKRLYLFSHWLEDISVILPIHSPPLIALCTLETLTQNLACIQYDVRTSLLDGVTPIEGVVVEIRGLPQPEGVAHRLKVVWDK